VLIFDELLNLPLGAQQLLLDFVQFGTYRPLGYSGVGVLNFSARVIAATNGDVKAAVQQGDLREDLLHRFAGFRLALPPLRERRGDPAAEMLLGRQRTRTRHLRQGLPSL
jgi:DNA-binding NtrC family response regulator